jgi:hypothetical protein
MECPSCHKEIKVAKRLSNKYIDGGGAGCYSGSPVVAIHCFDCDTDFVIDTKTIDPIAELDARVKTFRLQ